MAIIGNSLVDWLLPNALEQLIREYAASPAPPQGFRIEFPRTLLVLDIGPFIDPSSAGRDVVSLKAGSIGTTEGSPLYVRSEGSAGTQDVRIVAPSSFGVVADGSFPVTPGGGTFPISAAATLNTALKGGPGTSASNPLYTSGGGSVAPPARPLVGGSVSQRTQTGLTSLEIPLGGGTPQIVSDFGMAWDYDLGIAPAVTGAPGVLLSVNYQPSAGVEAWLPVAVSDGVKPIPYGFRDVADWKTLVWRSLLSVPLLITGAGSGSKVRIDFLAIGGTSNWAEYHVGRAASSAEMAAHEAASRPPSDKRKLRRRRKTK